MTSSNLSQYLPNKWFTDSLNFLIVYFLIGFSGIFSFLSMGKNALIFFLGALYLAKRPKLKINNILLLWFIYFIIIITLQDVAFGGGFSLKNVLMWSVRFFLPMLVIVSIRDKFLDVFINVMRVIALISIVIYIIIFIYPQGGEFFLRYGAPADIIDSTYSTFFYSYTRPNIYNQYQIVSRLYGPFTEPGRYAFFLIIGLLLNYFKTRKFMNFTGLLFIISIFATQSTAGYLSMLFVFLYSIYLTRFKLLSWVFLVVIIVGSYYVYRLPFMRSKIQQETYIATTSDINQARQGRGHQAVKSIYSFRRHFAFGAGLTYESALGLSDADISGFSLLDIGRKSGVVGFVLYCLGLFSFLFYLQKTHTNMDSYISVLFLFISISIVLSSQQVLFFSPAALTIVYYGLLHYRVFRSFKNDRIKNQISFQHI